jgi:hypothetical protein
MLRAGSLPDPGRPLRSEDSGTRWFRTVKAQQDDRPTIRTFEPAPVKEVVFPFACSTCGRTDLPETGDWDPPICQECDAAINEDELREEYADDPW